MCIYSRRRNDSLKKAKHYAQDGALGMAQAWLERASNYYPLTEMQIWLFKQSVDRKIFKQIDFSGIRFKEGFTALDIGGVGE